MENKSSFFSYLSNLMNLKVVAGERTLGRTFDFAIRPDEPFPKLSHLIIGGRGRKKRVSVPFTEITGWDKESIYLKEDFQDRLSEAAGPSADRIYLRDEVLDRQVVDTFGAKLERVNDLHLLIQHPPEIRIVHVDIGIRGLLRRLGAIQFVDWFTRWIFDYQIPPRFISWKYVQPLTPENVDRLKLTAAHADLKEIHSAEMADIFEELSEHEALTFIKTLDSETAAEALAEAEPKTQRAILMGMEDQMAADIIEDMPPDEAADVLADIPEMKAQSIMNELEREEKEELSELMNFDEETAGGLMTTEFIKIPAGSSVEGALALLRGEIAESEIIHYLYVVNSDDEPVGVVSIKELIMAEPGDPITDIMHANVIRLKTEDDRKDMLNRFQKYKLHCLPVIDDEGKISGVVAFRDLMELMFPKLLQ
ncbi:magnesium transporter MgtE N-terminal domain-containing protein [candidate division KSB1 bacterium]